MMCLAHTSYFVQVLANRTFGLISSFPISCLQLVSCEDLPSDIRNTITSALRLRRSEHE